MPMNRETGKDRWSRVPKDYFKGRDTIQNAKLAASVLAFVLAVGWFASGVDWKDPTSPNATDGNSLRANHGTLARVHATWDDRCDACHVPFEPIDGRGLFASSSTPANRSGDKLCMACHAGPSHHESAIEAEVKGCAECHRDHRGRDASLVRPPDRECTRCHRALDEHLKEGIPGFARKASRFDADGHPPFVPEAVEKVGETLRDRGKLKFNHARHMRPGIVENPEDTPYTVDRIPLASERSRYRKAGPPTDPVQLDCSSCHQLDPGEIQVAPNPAVASSTAPSRSPGRYYRPVTFENQCRACHVLSFDPAMKDVEVPHGVQPDQVVDFLKRTYAAQVISDDPKLLDVFVPADRLPGSTPVEPTAGQRRDEAIEKALTFLFPREAKDQPGQNHNNCLECHHYGQEEAQGIPTRVEPTRVPEIWFTHASFNHTAHRGVSCRECHANSYPLGEDGQTSNPRASSSGADYLIPGIDNCVKCHAPSRERGWFGSPPASSGGVASADCTECHRYHNGDQVHQGAGAPARDASVKRTIREFLRGTGDRPLRRPED